MAFDVLEAPPAHEKSEPNLVSKAPRKPMSKSARAKIGAAQKKRWAKQKKYSSGIYVKNGRVLPMKKRA